MTKFVRPVTCKADLSLIGFSALRGESNVNRVRHGVCILSEGEMHYLGAVVSSSGVRERSKQNELKIFVTMTVN